MNKDASVRAVGRLLEIMAVLRSPEGCPWDAAQTTESLKPFLVEETYEVLEAIDRRSPAAICEELGDLLLQIVFHARIFEERGEFDLGDVAAAITSKLERRHPHVFGDEKERDLEVLGSRWETIKTGERGETVSPLAGIPAGLPALMRASKVARRASRLGLDRPAPLQTVLETLRREMHGLEEAIQRDDRGECEQFLGTLLFELAGLGSRLDIDAEEALRQKTEAVLKRHASGE